MLCDICHENNATVHLTEIINERVVEMHICQACAQSKANELNKHLNIPGFLGSLADMVGSPIKKSLLKCSFCGLSYEEFKEKGRLGCGNCYLTFRKLLLPLLKRVHGATQHTGKTPGHIDKKVSRQTKINDLQAHLKRAIQSEEYEEAAKIRDQIKELESKKKS